MRTRYNKISDEIESELKGEEMNKILKLNEDISKKIKSTEATVIILENQVRELEKLNQTVVQKCFKNTQSAIESRQTSRK